LTLWNKELAYGIPTYLRGSANNDTEYSSIIDFFLSNNSIMNPYMEINNEASLGSDHKPVFFSFIHSLPPPPLVTLHPRKLWNIQKFKYKTEKNNNMQNPMQELISSAMYESLDATVKKYAKATNKIKSIRKGRGGFITFQSMAGPQDAVDQLTENWKNTFN
ncbi:hypothetical protein ABG067_007932, partial [Albugo candida]